MDEQPPRFPRYPDDSADEPFPAFEGRDEEPLPIQRATGARPYRGGGQPNPWLVGLSVAAVLFAISIVAFGLFGGGDEEPGAGSTVTTQPTGSTASTGSTDPSTSSTDPGASTSSTDATGSTVPTVETPAIVPIGDPIPLGELTLSSNDIGPLDFGTSGDEVLGRLAATFGTPDDDTGFIVGSGTFGECIGDSVRVVRWGPLAVVVTGEPGANQFVSYRLDLAFGNFSSDATNLQTLSGLRVGQTVDDLEKTYSNFVVEYRVDETAGLVFELRSSRGGDVLLWGPVESQEANGLVTGIYSPDSCTA